MSEHQEQSNKPHNRSPPSKASITFVPRPSGPQPPLPDNFAYIEESDSDIDVNIVQVQRPQPQPKPLTNIRNHPYDTRDGVMSEHQEQSNKRKRIAEEVDLDVSCFNIAMAWQCRSCKQTYPQTDGSIKQLKLAREYNTRRRLETTSSANCKTCEDVIDGPNLSIVKWCIHCKTKATVKDNKCITCKGSEESFVALGQFVGYFKNWN